jgi:hypothetical protein
MPADKDLLNTGGVYRRPSTAWSSSPSGPSSWPSSNPGKSRLTWAPALTWTSPIRSLEAAYKFKTDMFYVDLFGGYQTYELDNQARTWDVDSYVYGLNGGVTVGPAKVMASIYGGTNMGANTAGALVLPAIWTRLTTRSSPAAKSATPTRSAGWRS